MKNTEWYEWHVDSIQDCLAQICGQLDDINDHGRCRHFCDETLLDLDHAITSIERLEFNTIPKSSWSEIMSLFENIEVSGPTVDQQAKARTLLNGEYFSRRTRWKYQG